MSWKSPDSFVSDNVDVVLKKSREKILLFAKVIDFYINQISRTKILKISTIKKKSYISKQWPSKIENFRFLKILRTQILKMSLKLMKTPGNDVFGSG